METALYAAAWIVLTVLLHLLFSLTWWQSIFAGWILAAILAMLITIAVGIQQIKDRLR